MVRVGLALYGYVSPPVGEAPASLLDVRPPLAWKARLIAVKDLPAGALVGYNGSFRAPRPMRIGVVAAGYADGVDRRLSGRGHVIAAGRLAPILGVVSMDATTIDLSQAPALAPGDEVTLLGTEGAATIDAQHIADLTGAIPYTVLCGIGARVRRVYT
jgi:alanine racemase